MITATQTTYNKFQVAELDKRTRSGYKMMQALQGKFGEGQFRGTMNGEACTFDTYKLTWTLDRNTREAKEQAGA